MKKILTIFSVIILITILFIFALSLFFGGYKISTTSMSPTLRINTLVYVNKHIYGFSKHSLPYSFIPFSGRILEKTPKLGDIIAFKKTTRKATIISRLVGQPGDKIQMINGQLHRNGTAVTRKKIADFNYMNKTGNTHPVEQYTETLPNGTHYTIISLGDNQQGDNTLVFEVPENHYFVMGDNRDNSNDSRYSGMIRFENLIGRVDYIIQPTNKP